jgi:phosphoribosylaminoimidazolecarboxamide formyltransferase/IMP cyclohydrolase
MNPNKKIAIISVTEKDGIVEFARNLLPFGYDIISSGGTARTLIEGGVPVTDVADFTGLKAMLGHRVATLHPKIYAGVLALDNPEHMAELLAAGYERIDLVCVDFYPLEQKITTPGTTPDQVRESTDIGGPTMVRAGAKGLRITICDPRDRAPVIEWLKAGEPDRDLFILKLAAKAEFVVSKYCAASAGYLSGGEYTVLFGTREKMLRYGENPYQTPAYLVNSGSVYPLALSKFTTHAGNPSFINYTDIDRALTTMVRIAAVFDHNYGSAPYCAVGVKHGNACGAAIATTKEEAVDKMLRGNLRSIFGGAVILNFEINADIANLLVFSHLSEGQPRRPLDLVAASTVTKEAIEILKRKNERCLIITNPELRTLGKHSLDTTPLRRQVFGGDWLQQPNSTYLFDLQSENLKKYGAPGNLSATELEALNHDTLLAWAVCATSNSNTVTLAKGGMLIGNGVAQQDRVEVAELAVKRAREAHHDPFQAVAVSDSFFPFDDAPRALEHAGVCRIVATSGSLKDQETIDLFAISKSCELWHTPDKDGRIFFGH